MSLKPVQGLILVAAITAGLVAVGYALSSQESPSPNQNKGATSQVAQTQRGQSEAELRSAAETFLSTIETGEPLGLLKFWPDSGVTLGVDMEDRPISKSMFREQVEKKGELFCIFFDSDCLTRIRNKSRRRTNKAASGKTDYSYRDVLKKATGKTLHVSERREGNTLAGYVQVHLDGELAKLNMPHELDFTFTFEKEGWKLAEMPYY